MFRIKYDESKKLLDFRKVLVKLAELYTILHIGIVTVGKKIIITTG